jgi:hypothetical protein
MPLDYSFSRTPKGRAVARSFASGEVSADDARASMAALAAGGPYHGMANMSVVDPSASYSPESRKLFASITNLGGPFAVVVSSAAMRVMLNFVIKAATLKAAAFGGPVAAYAVQFFKSEAEALAWLDTQP